MSKQLSEEERIERIAELAEQYGHEGEIEFDTITAAEISEGDDNGAYVRAWVWVSFGGTDLDKERDGEDEDDDDDEDEDEDEEIAAS